MTEVFYLACVRVWPLTRNTILGEFN